MPPVNRLQRTEFLGVPVWHAPFRPSHADWPIVATYAHLVWRADEHDIDPGFAPDDEEH